LTYSNDNPVFPASEFDAWAGGYDPSVFGCVSFPFEGYEQLLKKIVQMAKPQQGDAVLDVGTGTGNLAILFAEAGCELWGTDFSEVMLAQARLKLPKAHFLEHDLHEPLPFDAQTQFDHIVSAYVFHHFGMEEKVWITRGLLKHLKPGGRIITGDIAFPDRIGLEQVKRSVGDEWDEELYWLADETLMAFESAGIKVNHRQLSPYTGIFVLSI
jgi:putative AdoMet-dependent methyltransferase